MELKIIETISGLTEIEPLWHRFTCEYFPHLCNSFHWQTAARESYFQNAFFKVILFREGGQLVGILPLCRSRSTFVKLPVRKYHFFEQGVGLSTLTILPGYLEACFRQLWNSFHLLLPGLQVLKISCSGDQKSRLQDFFRKQQDSSFSLLFLEKEALGLNLNGGEAFWENVLDAKQRREYRRLESRITADFESKLIQIDPPALPARFEFCWQCFLNIYRRSWKDQSHRSISALSSENNFFRTVFKHYAGQGQLSVSFLQLNGREVASNWWVNHLGMYYGLQTVFDMDYKPYSPGIYLIQKDLEKLIGEGHYHFDFMGAQPYKKKFSNTKTACFDLYILNGSLYGKLLRKLSGKARMNFQPL